MMPDARLVYLLRNPIERTLSNHMHNCYSGRENRSFSDVIRVPNNSCVASSKYFYQIEEYLQYFEKSQILIVQSEDLRRDPQSVLNEIAGFVDLSNNFDPDVVNKRFHQSSAKKRPSGIEMALRKRFKNRWLQGGIKVAGKPFRKQLAQEVLSAVDRAYLHEQFEPDIRQLQEFSGKDFSHWLSQGR